MKKLVLVMIIGLFAFPACSFLRPGPDQAANQKPANNTNSAPAPGNGQAVIAGNTGSKGDLNEIPVTKKECESVDTGDNALLNAQTFPFDFEPFRNSCFVTSYNPEYDEPPMESEIAIYKGGKKVFDSRASSTVS